jgi:hypothetical protein
LHTHTHTHICMYIKINLYKRWTHKCFGQTFEHLQVYKIPSLGTLILTCRCILYPWKWSHGWPKHVAVHCLYKLILIYSGTSLSSTIVQYLRTNVYILFLTFFCLSFSSSLFLAVHSLALYLLHITFFSKPTIALLVIVHYLYSFFLRR